MRAGAGKSPTPELEAARERARLARSIRGILGFMKDFYRTELGKTLRIGESGDGMLTIEILKDGVWCAAPLGMIGLRLARTTHRLTLSEIKNLPD